MYLAVTSRLLNRPVSVAVKGQSSCGKTATTLGVLEFFPESAFYLLSSVTEKALSYLAEPMKHRMLMVYELDGVSGKFAKNTLKTLLSEGKIKHLVTTKVGGEFTAQVVEKEGPTGLLLTTTVPYWDHEMETRMMSVAVDESPEQTQRVVASIAGTAAAPGRTVVDVTTWQALQSWLELAERRVVIPFAPQLEIPLAAGIQPRMRRDFGKFLSLIVSHAILHQASRPRNGDGWIEATLDDYAAVRDLFGDLMAQDIQNAVPKTVRETVTALKALVAVHPAGVSEPVMAAELRLDKSGASRRLKVAAGLGYAKNLEPKLGRPARWVLDNPLPDDQQILPTVEQLADAVRCCSPNP
jgi:hypothetical protein